MPWSSCAATTRTDFTSDEAKFVSRISPTVAAGFRAVLVRQHFDHGDDAREAGILMLAGEPLQIRTATPAARQWLDELDDGGFGDHLPTSVISAAQAAPVDGGRVGHRAGTAREPGGGSR